MKCPGCKAETHRFFAMAENGVERYACPSCEEKAPRPLKLALRRHSSKRSRKFERFELPLDVIHSTQKAAPRVKYPDSPALRNIAAIDAPKKRARVFEMGDTPKSSRSSRVMNKLTAQLGPNPKILKDDGFEVLAEASA